MLPEIREPPPGVRIRVGQRSKLARDIYRLSLIDILHVRRRSGLQIARDVLDQDFPHQDVSSSRRIRSLPVDAPKTFDGRSRQLHAAASNATVAKTSEVGVIERERRDVPQIRR